MKTIIIDIGNTCIKVTTFSGENIVASTYFLHNETEMLRKFLKNSSADNGAYAAVGHISDNLKAAFEEAAFPMKEIKVADIPDSLTRIKYSTPQTLGIDRIAAAIGAMSLSPSCNILVVDAGTCVTYDILTKERDYLGGMISPGIDMRLESLSKFTAKLPLVNADGDVPNIGYSTETAIRSGVIKGISYEIEGFINQLSSVFNCLKVYLTGGAAKLLRISNKNHTFADDFLVERGIFTIYKATKYIGNANTQQ